MNRIKTISLQDFELDTTEDIINQINDCRNAITSLYNKEMELSKKNSFTFGTKEEHIAAIYKEIDNYRNEEMRLQLGLELIYNSNMWY
jgi:hypothetical protein